MKQNLVGWFEIPVRDMERASTFYETVFDISISIHDFGDTLMGWFPFDPQKSGATGSLIKNKSYTPSHDGTLVYFTCEDLQNELNRVEKAGGQVLKGKTQISPEHGFMAVVEDTEGNRIALHSNK